MALVGIESSGGNTLAEIAAAVASSLNNIGTGDVRSACLAALTIATTDPGGSIYQMLVQETQAPYGSLHGLMNPGSVDDLNPTLSGPHSGATSYTIVSAPGFGRLVMYGWTVTASAATTLTWWSGGAVPLTADHPVAAGVPWVIAPGSRQSLRANTEDQLVLRSSNAAAILTVTCWQRTVTG